MAAGIRKKRKLTQPMEARSPRKFSRWPMETPMVKISRAVQTTCSFSFSSLYFGGKNRFPRRTPANITIRISISFDSFQTIILPRLSAIISFAVPTVNPESDGQARPDVRPVPRAGRNFCGVSRKSVIEYCNMYP